mgnify:CR=1 FL=1|tara:strand:+ start:5045 stop:5842 length:798 start_codon:yes stop_codon:yes gene_type:complete
MYRKNIIYLITIFFGIVEQIAKIGAFMIPIKAIKIVDKGKVIPEIKGPLSIFNIDVNTNFDQYLFLSIVFLFLIIGIILLNVIRNELIKKIKIRNLLRIFKTSKEKEISNQYLYGKLKDIDDFINFRTTLLYSAILLIFVTYYDYQISIIIIFNCILNYIFTKKINNSSKSNISNNDSYSSQKSIEIIKYDYRFLRIKSSIKPFINTFTMFCIMTSIFLREQITVSIIFIFLIRIYLNKINDVIIKIAENKVFLNSILNKIKIKN